MPRSSNVQLASIESATSVSMAVLVLSVSIIRFLSDGAKGQLIDTATSSRWGLALRNGHLTGVQCGRLGEASLRRDGKFSHTILTRV